MIELEKQVNELASRLADMKQKNEALETSLAEMSASHERVSKQLQVSLASGEADREDRRAALNLTEEAIAARREAEAATRANDDFLATLGHELRTPLSAILLWAGALKSGKVPLSELDRAVHAIEESAKTQSRLIEDLLDLSRLRAKRLPLSSARIDLARLILAATEMVKPMADRKQVTLATEIEPALGDTAGDETRLERVLWNLLSNAVKFTPAGGHVTVRARRDAADIEIEVEDDGEGIPPPFLPYVFDKFRQADQGERRRHMGLGIGLALAKELVELHAGTIVAESDGKGRGALFRVRLPWRDPSALLVVKRMQANEETSDATLAGTWVAVVEDDANTRTAIAWTLERAGARVSVAADVEAGLALFDASPGPDVLLSDVGLPGKSGFELIKTLVKRYRERGFDPPASCAVSAHARPVDRRRAIEAGFDMYLVKPVSAAQLIEMVVDLRDVNARHRAP